MCSMIKERGLFSKGGARAGIESGKRYKFKGGGREPVEAAVFHYCKSGNFIIFINEILTSARPRSFRVRLNLISGPANLKQ